MKNGVGQAVCIEYSGGTYQSQPWWMRVDNMLIGFVQIGIGGEKRLAILLKS